MRLLLAFLLTPLLHAQTLASDPPAKVQADLTQAISGEWTGLLEYRDYSEPATSTKRVQLPTWLTITPSGNALREHFIYDDGPSKVVEETLHVALDVAASRYTITNDHNVVQPYKVVGYDSLHGGRGSLVITGPTIDNGRPAETRITMTIRRNLLTWTEENRAVASEPFAFRHSYTFTRAQPPSPRKQ